ncbi:MAG: acyl-CoA dehydrogenase [Legionellales bacterium]|nr:MAG: acyl-CoA dehydrogenase [Legionellales bacterium]
MLSISHTLYNYVRKVMPPMSATEQVAINSGTVGFEASLFRGSPDWHAVQTAYSNSLSAAEQNFLDNQVQTLCSKINDWEILANNDLPQEIWDYLHQEKFFALSIPKKYGGLEFSALANSAVVEMLSSCSISVAVTVMVPNSLGPAELLLEYGTTEQKNYYLPRLATKRELPCFALTSPEAGSDATAIIDSGIICKGTYNDAEIIGIKLNFNKRYITLAPVATLIGVAVKLLDPNQLIGNKVELGITLCLIDAAHKNITRLRHRPLDQAFMNGSIAGVDVFVPLNSIIGGVAMAGNGWQMLVECLSVGRGISLPALSSGISKLCYRASGAYARLRTQFKLPIGKFDGVASGLAHIAGFTYMINALRLFTLESIDSGNKPAVLTAITKYHTTEMARKAVNIAMDLHGGKGIMVGPHNYLANVYKSIPIAITVEGANILTRSLIIFGQGSIRCHPYILQEIMAVTNKNIKTGLRDFSKIIYKHIFYSVYNIIKLKFYTFLLPKSSYKRKITHMSLALAVMSEVALALLGGRIKRLELLSARLGDILSYLCIATAVLKYESANKANQELSESDYVAWSIAYCLNKSEQALTDFLDNFPNKIVARILRWCIVPFGRLHKPPLDNLAKKLSAHMLQDSALRDRLSQGCFFGADSILNDLEQGRLKAIQVDSFAIKLKNTC